MCLGPDIAAGIGALASAAGGASTLVPLGLGLGTSLLGGQMTANAQRQQQEQQLNQNLAAEQGRNAVLQNFLKTQKDYQANNQSELNTAIAADAQPKLAADQAASTASRMQNADNSVSNVITPNVAPPSSTGSTTEQNDLNARTAAGIGRAAAVTGANATLGAYGDTNAAMTNSALTAGRGIDTTNSFARGDAALLPSEQQFADFSARAQNPVQPVSTWGSSLSGLGNVFAALGGSGRLKNVFGA
jgi:hypothetical protein